MTRIDPPSSDASKGPQAPVVVYGATGYTGKLVTAEFARRGVPMVLAGRSAEKLTAAAALAGPLVRNTIVASLSDHDALCRVAGAGTVLANCAGPFAHTGGPVLRACAAAGTHYLDTTGEQGWIHRAFEDHDDELRRADVAAVPGMGLDFAPGDLLAHLVGVAVEPCTRIVIAYHLEGFGMTRGTQRSLLEAMGGRDIGFVDGDWATGAGARPVREFMTFPGAIGRQRVARYPAGEVVTVPRHVRTGEMVLRISGASVMPRASWVLPVTAPLLPSLLRTPAKGLLDRVIGRLPEGPSEDARRAVRWTITAEATGQDGRVARGIVSGPDVYGLTAVTIADGAAALGAENFAGRGVLAPAQALDPATTLDALAEFGVEWSVDAR
ncbi:hypothetical protein DSM112329_02051 [Paraconexibacter sp. AEG42_29]|uniref:Saccharopine dehydrogenase NADP binding domain-containing protein n=1 Tax=Paraconexibacter sp. AEG42_29 TaxID=2997339 RepID=A0AAU7AU39_9ACTN